MTARTHDLAAVTALIVVVLNQPIRTISVATLLLCLIFNQIGGIAPDIDQPTAPFWRNLPVGGFFGRLIDKMLGGHRFFTHSLIGVALFTFLVHWLLIFIHPLMPKVDVSLVTWSFIIGILSHLVLDTLTKEGVPWLLPLPYKFGLPPIKSLRITTGKWMENVLFLALVVFNVLYGWAHYNLLVAILKRHLS